MFDTSKLNSPVSQINIDAELPTELGSFAFRIFKRGFDIVVSIALLPGLLGAILVLFVLNPFLNPGKIFFVQRRMGRNCEGFRAIKFRSMRADAEKLSGPVWASEDDPRITRFGKIMRKTRLDELPQLFNVLAGSMSIVGPRPERQHFVDQLAAKIPYFQLRHIVKPGVTGWAQINHGYAASVDESRTKLSYDLYYVRHHTLALDLDIMLRTFFVMLARIGSR